MAPARLQRWLAGFAERHGETVLIANEDVVYLRGLDGAQAWITIPFPPLPPTPQRPSDVQPKSDTQLRSDAQPRADSQPELADRLIAHVARTRRVGALLVRRGGYGVGIFTGSTLIASKVGSSYVQGTTKAGGWSQQRYARRRKNQADAAFAEAADHAVRILLPEARGLEALFCGGDHGAVAAVLADTRLQPLRRLVHPTIIDVVDPRLRVLTALPDQFLAIVIRLVP